jgi:flagellar basal-body rod protein FlgB
MRPAKSAQYKRAAPMAISDIPILAMLRERMQWHEARQQVLAENVANADTPNYQAKDLAPPTFDETGKYEVTPRGNSVTHEDEMMKAASNQMDFEAAASMYTHSLALIKLAIDR